MKYMTKQRKVIFDFFKVNNHNNYTANELYEELKDSGISLSAIYRNLLELEKENFIQKVIANNSFAYTYINTTSCSGLIHLMCTDCSNTFHASKELSNTLLSNDELYGFELNLQKTILYGKCNSCK